MDELFAVAPTTYGSDYQSHLLDQYRLYVEMADRISSRRGLANNFLLSVNALVVSGFGIITGVTDAASEGWVFALPLAGLIVCVSWFVLIARYRELNDAKFAVIHEIELRLPVALYRSEWAALGQTGTTNADGEKPSYKPLTYVERVIPGVFALLYVMLVAAGALERIL